MSINITSLLNGLWNSAIKWYGMVSPIAIQANLSKTARIVVRGAGGGGGAEYMCSNFMAPLQRPFNFGDARRKVFCEMESKYKVYRSIIKMYTVWCVLVITMNSSNDWFAQKGARYSRIDSTMWEISIPVWNFVQHAGAFDSLTDKIGLLLAF